LAVNETPPEIQDNSHTIDHITNIWRILQETPGFDTNRLLALIPQLLAKPQTQQMGQKVVSRLAQKTAARVIRQILLEQPAPTDNQIKYLPPAAIR
jgi:hypothetical protein